MTDYAKHIEALESLRQPAYLDPRHVEALTAAIELMRAAAPKSPEEERELVQQVTAEIPLAPDLASRIAIRDQILDLRAAARAEGYARGQTQEAVDYVMKDHAEAADMIARTIRAERELSAAQAEIERLRAKLDLETERLPIEFGAQIAERDAEIERLRAGQASISAVRTTQNDVGYLRAALDNQRADATEAREVRDAAVSAMDCAKQERNALETKLTNLRAAAERALHELNTSPSHGSYVARPILEDAIEASRK